MRVRREEEEKRTDDLNDRHVMSCHVMSCHVSASKSIFFSCLLVVYLTYLYYIAHCSVLYYIILYCIVSYRLSAVVDEDCSLNPTKRQNVIISKHTATGSYVF